MCRRGLTLTLAIQYCHTLIQSDAAAADYKATPPPLMKNARRGATASRKITQSRRWPAWPPVRRRTALYVALSCHAVLSDKRDTFSFAKMQGLDSVSCCVVTWRKKCGLLPTIFIPSIEWRHCRARLQKQCSENASNAGHSKTIFNNYSLALSYKIYAIENIAHRIMRNDANDKMVKMQQIWLRASTQCVLTIWPFVLCRNWKHIWVFKRPHYATQRTYLCS